MAYGEESFVVVNFITKIVLVIFFFKKGNSFIGTNLLLDRGGVGQ